MSRTLRLAAFYDSPREDVWTALTDPQALAEWMMPNDFRPEVGHVFRFQVDPQTGFNGIIDCEVTEVVPPERLAYRFQGRGRSVATVVVFTLTEQRGGTLLRLEHSGFDGFKGWMLEEIIGFGWNKMIPALLSDVVRHSAEGVFTPGAVAIERRTYTAERVPDDLEKSL